MRAIFLSSKFHKFQKKYSISSSSNDWETIYRFPYIVPCRIFAKVKFYMTVIVIGVFPIFYALQTDIFMQNMMKIIGGSFFSLGAMYLFGNIFRRLIGSIYVSKSNPELIRISHLTFFGNRSELLIPRHDVLMLSDSNPDLRSHLWAIKSLNKNSKATLFMFNIKFGGVMNRERFIELFGSLNDR
ncbi:Transmembrane protein [Sarcoptes scabiei]|uniref:Transmembrane protein 186 n=1 Tax=Sarcoptes scabiei TaxID=52283 RepID=A0A834R8Q0_SARSC|nr:Transmembrane protein [Sarcoptes scabiei]